MPIADYASRIRSAILETPHVVSHSLAYEDRPPVAGIVRGSAAFVDGSVLHFKEFLQLSPTVIRLKNAYQYVMTDGSLNFRYDNARDPAARRLSSYPHHKHVHDNIHPSPGPTLTEALQEAAALVKRFGK
jgi:hypothetical protein